MKQIHPYIPLEFLEGELQQQFPPYPERKNIGTPDDWLVKLSWLVGECYLRKGFDFRCFTHNPYSYGITSKTIRELFGNPERPRVNGKRVTKEYKLDALGLTKGDSNKKIMSLAFTEHQTGNGLSGCSTEWILKDKMVDVYIPLINLTHLKQTKEPRYILPKDYRKGYDLTKKIEVNETVLMRNISRIKRYVKDWEEKKTDLVPPDYLKNNIKSGEVINDNRLALKKIIEYKRELEYIILLESRGFEHNQYYETTEGGAGRLFYKKEDKKGNIYSHLNWQTEKKVIKDMCFSDMGYWDIDFNNCHIELLNQYYEQVTGEKHSWLEMYCDNYKVFRNKITDECKIHYGLAKELVIGLVYSGGTSIQQESQMIRLLHEKGTSKTVENIRYFYPTNTHDVIKRITRSQTIQEIRNNLQEITKTVKQKGGLNRQNEYYINPLYRKGYKYENKRPLKGMGEQLSHLLQGIEMLLLETVIRIYKNNIILLLHDGWVMDKLPDEGHLLEEIYQDTKIRMEEWNNRYSVGLKKPDGFRMKLTKREFTGHTISSYRPNPHPSKTHKRP